MFRGRDFLLRLGLIFSILLILTGCWDKKELDQLAMISMIGVDYDPEKDQIVMYYQVINPYSGASALEPGGPQSLVYTYRIEGRSFGEIRTLSFEWMSRYLFEAHFRILILSKSAAKHILREVVNYIESLPRAKASASVLVAEDSLHDIMNHFILLERVPAQAIQNRLRYLIDFSLYVSRDIQLRDISERMLQDRVVVLPMIKVLPGKSEQIEQRESNIDASQDNVIITGGAVIKDFKMVGKMVDSDLISYNVLNGAKGRHTKLMTLNGKEITLTYQPVRFKRTVTLRNNKPVITFHIDFMLTAERSIEYMPKTYQEAIKMEEAFDRRAKRKEQAFVEKYLAKGWDVVGVKDALKRYLPDYPQSDNILQEVEIQFVNHSNYMYPSHILESY